MPSLARAVLRWSAIELALINGLGGWLTSHAGLPLALLYPASWFVYGLAGREAARSGPTWYGLVAGASVAAVEQTVWLARGAPGHADTSDLPAVVAALTYLTTAAFVIVIGAVCGAAGGLLGRRARLRAREDAPSRASGA